LTLESGCGRETDCLLEGAGFEPSVPREGLPEDRDDGPSLPGPWQRKCRRGIKVRPLAELTRKLDAVPEGPQVMLKLAILDVPDFYSALTNHTGCRRPLASTPAGRQNRGLLFLDAGHTATGWGGLSTGGGGIGLGGSSIGGR
jgi:hypothetical protein